MGDRYLTDLADVIVVAGLAVVEYGDWRRRARSSGGYTAGLPNHVMVHHTASSASPESDVAYIADNADTAPIANLYLARDGAVWVIAAGATNTNGSGSAPWPGGCPDDQMNTHAIGIEAANNGVGEPWPLVQQDAYLTLCHALCAAYAIPADHVRAHWEWAPGRKIDPAGPSHWATGTASWDMPEFRVDAAGNGSTPPQPTPTPEDDMPAYGPYLIQATGADGTPNGRVYACDRQFMTVRWLPTEESLAGYRWQLRQAGATAPELGDGAPIMAVDTIAAFGVIIA